MTARPQPAPAGAFVLMMGTVTLFGTMAYEGARALLGPTFALLGVGGATVGLVAGIGELIGYGGRIFSGALGEKTRAYWSLVFVGYLINLLAVPAFAFAGNWELVVLLLWAERFAKALRSPARTALTTHTSNDAALGRRFGFEAAFDQIGAVLGPLLAMFGLWYSEGTTALARHQDAFKVLAASALAAAALVLVARSRFPKVDAPSTTHAGPPLGAPFKGLVLAGALLGFGSADWALVSFHAVKIEAVSLGVLPALYAVAMLAAAVASLLLGRLFDRGGPGLLAGVAVGSAAAAPLVFGAGGPIALTAGALIWGASIGGQESLYRASIGRLVSAEQRVRALGIFFAVYGLAWCAGSAAMGWLYEHALPAVGWVATAAQLLAAPIFLAAGRKAPPG